MNDVSIIINGVRYDAVEAAETQSCQECELNWGLCIKAMGLCSDNTVFKKSNKSFER